MSDAQVIQKLTEFERLFNLSNLVNDALRTVGWIFVRGLSLLIDSLESLTDDILMIKTFFNNPQVVEFVQTIQPFLYVLLAASFVFTGYLIIFQKKFDREGLLINIFISLMILGLLSPTMKQLNDFTDQAVNQVKSGSLFGSEKETISESILKENLNDLVAYDKNGFKNYTENDAKNNVPTKLIKGLQINEVFDSNKLDISTTGSKLSKSFILWDGSEEVLGELDQSGLDWNNQYYYRYHPNWLTILVTLGVMGFTLFSIAYKLARLSFELAFNYVLAILVAPADLHSGQKTKKVIQSILNTFLVIILIFVSIKLYTIGTAYLADTLDGLAYLIALIAFSAALIDGPNMVERLFGIDAGLKRGWGVALGAYAVGKGTAKVGARVAGQTMKRTSRPTTPSASEAASTKLPPNPPPNGGTPTGRPDRSSDSVPFRSQAQERTSRPTGQENQRIESTDLSTHDMNSESPTATISKESMPRRSDSVSSQSPATTPSSSQTPVSQPKMPDGSLKEQPTTSPDAFNPSETTVASQPTSPSEQPIGSRVPNPSSVHSGSTSDMKSNVFEHSFNTPEDAAPTISSSGTSNPSPSITESQETSSGTQRQRKSIYQTLETTTQKELKHIERTQTRVTSESSRMYSTDVPRLDPKKE
ncbi:MULTISPECIES: pLS20_p028 family conjugation system transmembrane protein [unclassified Exiguobacterium]|uniref:pLS20_p028 family conjugation system transmembrane protein n=1 Tax=unclassified Exiguobacterium TaxID=2644629 RepID=UPI0033355FDA